jgi:hypothetical protein
MSKDMTEKHTGGDVLCAAFAALREQRDELLATLKTARNQVVAFAIDSIGAERAVEAVQYIDAAIAKATSHEG